MATSPIPRQRPPVQAGGIRRSFTQPPRSLSFHEKAGLDPSDSAADILYSHPRARIVSFTPPTDAVRSASSPASVDLDYPVDTIETLPWKSSSEDILASGSLIIEKIRGSTNFLKSGTKPLHALMRNSQCWCVDGEATLVMRVGPFKYYRIELPYVTEEDKAKVQQLKDVLKRILRFEATPCPFKRGFHVDLPESASTPRRKGPWKRRPGSLLSSPVTATTSPLSLKKSRVRPDSENMEMQFDTRLSPAEFKDENEDDLSDGRGLEDDDGEAQRDLVVGEDGDLVRTDSSLQDDTQISNLSPNANSGEKPSPSLNSQAVEDPLHSSEEEVVVHVDGDDEEAPLPLELLDSHVATRILLESEDVDRKDRESATIISNNFDQQSEIAADSSHSTEGPAIALNHSVNLPDAAPKHSGKTTTECHSDLLEKTDGLINLVVEGLLNNGETAEDIENGSNSGHLPSDSEERALGGDAHSLEELSTESPPNEVNFGNVEEIESPQILSQSLSNSSDAVSISSRADSFHSLASLENDLSNVEVDPAESSDPTPLAKTNDHVTLSPRHHQRDTSEMTVTGDNEATLQANLPLSPPRPSTAVSENPSTPSLLRSSASDSSWPEIETPIAISGDDGIRRRPKAKRSFSPLTPSSDLFAPSPQSPRGNHLTGAILQTARHLALVKPMEVVVMLAHIFARIASGATVSDLMNGDLFRRPIQPAIERRRRNSVPDQADSRKGEASEEDDYGVPIRGRSRSAAPMVRKDDDADSLFDLD